MARGNKHWRLAKNVSRERAEDKGLRGQRAARYIDKEWRGIAQQIDMGFRKPGPKGTEIPLRQARKRYIKGLRKEVKRRRNN